MTEQEVCASQEAYTEDVQRLPLYHDGTARKSWDALCDAAKWSWSRWPDPPWS